MIGRMCKFRDGLSRPVLIARETFSKRDITHIEVISIRSFLEIFSQVIYCRGYSGEEPPLPIPNREVKPGIADGTAPPGGRVGRRRPSESPIVKRRPGFLLLLRKPKAGGVRCLIGRLCGSACGGGYSRPRRRITADLLRTGYLPSGFASPGLWPRARASRRPRITLAPTEGKPASVSGVQFRTHT